MMESNFYSDEFEQLIREKTEQYKMYPSEKVWKGVHSSLHTKRKWFITGMFLLVTGILFMAGRELILPSHTVPSKKTAAVSGPAASGSKTPEAQDENPSTIAYSSFRPNASSSTASKHDSESGDEDPSIAHQPYKGLNITIGNPVISQPDLSEYLSKAVGLPTQAPALPVDARMVARADNTTPADDKSPVQDMGVQADNAIAQENGAGGVKVDMRGDAKEDARGDAKLMRAAKNSLPVTTAVAGPDVKEDLLKDPAGTASRNSPLNTLSEALDQQRSNWLQEYALYSLPSSTKRGRKYWQVYLAPAVNYRTLSGGYIPPDKFVNLQNLPSSVVHFGEGYGVSSPAPGFEAGGSLLYRVTRNLTVKAGLQFNMSRYEIKAYSSPDPQTGKSLYSYFGSYVDSIRQISNGLNYDGKREETHNINYYQLSLPVGFELRVLGNEQLQLHIGASLAPTYLLNRNAYLLSPDYSNYVKNPSLYRRWNLDGGFETFLSYRTGNVTWQVGPEFRYQLFSTFSGQYPLGETQKGYGLKFGIVKALR